MNSAHSRSLLNALLAVWLLWGSAAPTLAADDAQIRQLKALLEKQQAIIESQGARLEQQERLLQRLASKLEPVNAAPAIVTTPPAVAEVASPAATKDSTAAAETTVAAPAPHNAMAPLPVGTRFSGLRVTLGGALRTTVTTTTARMTPDATPFLVLPKVPGVPDGTTKIDARLSSLLINVQGVQVGEYQLGGMIYAYLFDGDLLSGKYGLYPGFAYVDATSDKWRFAAGLQQDVFSPLMPTMVDRMSAFAGSGNVGNSFKPQIRAERFFVNGDDRVVLQAALADALPSNIKPEFTNSTENTGVPNMEARIAWTRGKEGEATLPWAQYMLGLSGARGEFRTIYDKDSAAAITRYAAYQTDLYGVALEAAWRISDRLGIQGEYYRGEALGAYLGTAFQTVNTVRRAPIAGDGYWAEVAWYWNKSLHQHFGYGADRADRADGPIILSNETAFANAFWDFGRMTTLGFETTWRETEYAGGVSNDGFAFMFSSELRF